MSTNVAGEYEASGVRGKLLAGYYLIRRSFALSFAVFGVLVAASAPIVEQYNAVLGGMAGIWGVSFVLIGVVVWVLFRLMPMLDELDFEEEER